MPATLQLAATTLRAVLGKMEMDEILAHRDRINNEIRTILDTRTEQWGVEISAVEIKDIQLPREMQRAMARQAEAERERRAKVIAAEGEVQAASKLAEAAAMIAGHPARVAAAPVPDAGRGLGPGVVDDRLPGADRPVGRRRGRQRSAGAGHDAERGRAGRQREGPAADRRDRARTRWSRRPVRAVSRRRPIKKTTSWSRRAAADRPPTASRPAVAGPLIPTFSPRTGRRGRKGTECASSGFSPSVEFRLLSAACNSLFSPSPRLRGEGRDEGSAVLPRPRQAGGISTVISPSPVTRA